MKLKRTHAAQPRNFDEFAEVAGSLYGAYDTSIVTCARLVERRADRGELDDDDRREAARHAKWLAGCVLWMRRGLGDRFAPAEVIGSWLPPGIFGAAGRLSYALLALAEEDPEPEALLTLEELDGLARQYALVEWLAGMREGLAEPS